MTSPLFAPSGIPLDFPAHIVTGSPEKTNEVLNGKFSGTHNRQEVNIWAPCECPKQTNLPFQLSGRWLCETGRQKLWSWSSACKFHCPGWRRNASDPPRSLEPRTRPCLRSGCRGCTWAARCSAGWRTWCRCSCCWDPGTGTPYRRAPRNRSCSVHSVFRKPLRTSESWMIYKVIKNIR